MSKIQSRAPRARKPDDAMSVARQALHIARSLRASEELKYLDTSYSLTDFTTGVVTPLSAIAGGSGQGQRTGNSVRLHRVQMTGKLYDLANSNTTFRVILFSVPQWQSTVTVAGGVQGVLEADQTIALYEGDSRVGARVHFDSLVTDNANFNLQDHVMTVQYDRKLSLPITFTGANGTDYDENQLFLLITADYVSSVGPVVRPVAAEAGCSLRFRVTYTDA